MKNEKSFDEIIDSLMNQSPENRAFFSESETIAHVVNSLIEARVQKGLTQRQLAAQCGLKQAAIARLESLRAIPRLDTLATLATALGLEIDVHSKNLMIPVPKTVYQYCVSWNTVTPTSGVEYRKDACNCDDSASELLFQ